MLKISHLKSVVNFLFLSCVVFLAGTTYANSDVVFRINSGGKAFKDGQGQKWWADSYSRGGVASRVSSRTSIKGTNNDTLYRSTRNQSNKNRELSYRIPVKNGTYDVRLHFAEISKGAQGKGKRVFHIEAEGLRRVSNYDPFRNAGSGFKATTKKVSNIKVTDGKLDLKLPNSKQLAFVSGIEVIARSLDTASIKSSNSSGLTITTHPSNVLVNPGQRVIMKAKGRGRGKLRYQWYYNNKILRGESNARLVLASADKNDQGKYHCVVSAGKDSVRTNSASLVVAGKAKSNVYKSATLKWSSPKKRTNGRYMRVSEISHYEVYYSDKHSGSMKLESKVKGSNNQYVAEGLDRGNHYFALVAVDTRGKKSKFSKTIKVKIR